MITTNVVQRNAVLLFDNDLNARFIELSEKVNQIVPSKVVLNLKNMIPHLTNYGSNFPKINLIRLPQHIEKISKSSKPLKLKFISKSIVAGTIFVDAELSKELYALHVKVTEALNSLRDGLYNRKELELPGTSETMKFNLIKYGMTLVKSEYKAHVTVARPYDSQRCDVATGMLPEKIEFETKITSISIVETGPNGTCKRIIQSFPFRTENNHVSYSE